MKYKRKRKWSFRESDSGLDSVVDKRMNIPGYYYDPELDSYFRIEEGFSTPTVPKCIARQQTPVRPVKDKKPGNVFDFMYRRSIGHLSEEAALHFALHAVKKENSSPIQTQHDSNQVLVRPDASGLIFASRGSLISRQLTATDRKLVLGSPELLFHRSAQVNAEWTRHGSNSDALLVVRNSPPFRWHQRTKLDLIHVDKEHYQVHNDNPVNNILSTTLDHLLLRLGNSQRHGLNKCSFVRCAQWNCLNQTLAVGVEGKLLLYNVERETTKDVKCRNSHSLAVVDNMLYVGRSKGISLIDRRQNRPTSFLNFDSDIVVRQLSPIKNGRYLLAEDQAGQIYQSDCRYPGRPVASMKNGTASSCRCIPFHVDEEDEVLTCGVDRHGVHLWDLKTNSLIHCLEYSEDLLTAVFKRKWNSVLAFLGDSIRVFRLP